MQFDTIMWRTRDINRFQSCKTTNAVIDVNDEITGCQACRFRDYILRTARFTNFPDKAIAKNVLLAYDDIVGRFKAALNAQCKEWDDRLLLAEKCPFFEVVKKSAEEIEFRLSGKRYVVPMDEVVLLGLENIATETLAQEFCHRFKERLDERLDQALLKGLIVGIEVHITESRGQGGVYYWGM